VAKFLFWIGRKDEAKSWQHWQNLVYFPA
jgi:hypothetical protein